MAKPTDEHLPLPDFKVPMVARHADKWVHSEIALKDWQAEQQKGVILYFYPKDNTPGCTTQANDFTASIEDFAALGYLIVGVSRDSIASHEKFIDKHNLQIALISDEDERLCQYFDVIKEKNMYGKKTMGLVRSAFVYSKDGKLTHAQRNLRAKGYTERLLSALPKA